MGARAHGGVGASSSSTSSSLASSTSIGFLPFLPFCELKRARFGPASLPHSSPSSASRGSLLSSKFLFGDLLALVSGSAYSGGNGAGDGERDERADKDGVGDGVLEPGRGTANGSETFFFEDTSLDGELIDLDRVRDDGLADDGVEGGPSLSLTRLTLAFCAWFDGGGGVASAFSSTGASSTYGRPA